MPATIMPTIKVGGTRRGVHKKHKLSVTFQAVNNVPAIISYVISQCHLCFLPNIEKWAGLLEKEGGTRQGVYKTHKLLVAFQAVNNVIANVSYDISQYCLCFLAFSLTMKLDQRRLITLI